MKKIIALALVLAMSTTVLAGCANEGTTSSATSSVTSSQEETSSEDKEEASSEEEKEEDKDTADLSIEAIYEAIAAVYPEEQLFATGAMPAEMVEGEFPIDTALYSEAVVYAPMISTFADRIAIFKAAEGKEADLLAAVEGVRDVKIADTMVYPQNVAKVKSAKVVANGEYVAFLMCGAMNENEDASEEDALKFAEEEVQKAVEAFNGLFA